MESFIQVTEGSGKKLHTFQRSIGGQFLEDEVVILGEPYLPTYSAVAAGADASAAGNQLLVLNAGASTKLRIRAIELGLRAATAAGIVELVVRRATSAPSGGTVVTPGPFDPADPAAAATAMQSPTTLATTSTVLLRPTLYTAATAPQAIGGRWRWEAGDRHKPIIVPAGTANGIMVAVVTGVAGGSVNVWIEFDEASF